MTNQHSNPSNPSNPSNNQRPPNTSDIVSVLTARSKTHGRFAHNAEVSQQIKDTLRSGARWGGLPSEHAEALDAIAAKAARIVNGDHLHTDHWLDIIGYAQLALDAIRGAEHPDPHRIAYDPDGDLEGSEP